ncbi:hypothetical protein DY000_02033048 [Brassica cretica]|uniref:Uncharacterized protein n=1 Tax=Brassica cretica TaxID=69181 RepID=A0ABQ7DWU5_BRACR|nr:hypothetical protein DY000_02033048 [Brassica cretica]
MCLCHGDVVCDGRDNGDMWCKKEAITIQTREREVGAMRKIEREVKAMMKKREGDEEERGRDIGNKKGERGEREGNEEEEIERDKGNLALDVPCGVSIVLR